MKRIAFAVAGALVALPAAAQNFPTKPVRIIVATAPGPGVDYVARLAAPKISEDLGQPLIIENQAGANGIIATSTVARAAPDGYTMVMATPSMIVTAKFLVRDLPYDPVKDLAPVSCAVEPFTSLAVNPSLPVKNIGELIDYAKKNPGKLSYASSGVGSVFHMVGEMFNNAAGVNIVHVPYKSVPPAVQAVMANEVPMVYAAISNTYPQMRAGKVKILGILESKRAPSLPDVPTVGETVPGFVKPPSWFGYLAPGNTPKPVVQRLNSAIVKALHNAEVKKTLEEQGSNVIASSPEEFVTLIANGFDIYAKAIKIAGLKPE